MNSYKEIAIVALVVVMVAAVACAGEQLELHVSSEDHSGPEVSQLVSIESTASLGELKQKIQAETGIPVRKQRLVCGKHASVMEDDSKTLAAYKCKSGGTVRMFYGGRGGFVANRLFVRTPGHTTSGNHEEVRYQSPEDTVASLEATVAALLGLPVDEISLEVEHKGAAADGFKRLSDYGIEDDDVLTPVPRVGQDGAYPIRVTTYTLDARDKKVNAYLSVKPTDTVAELRTKIHTTFDMPLESLKHLRFAHAELADESKTLADMKIRLGKTVEINLVIGNY